MRSGRATRASARDGIILTVSDMTLFHGLDVCGHVKAGFFLGGAAPGEAIGLGAAIGCRGSRTSTAAVRQASPALLSGP